MPARTRLILIAVCAAAALWVAAAPARAQTVMSMIVLDERSTFAPDLSRADLAVFARVLGLSDDERGAMLDLYAAYASTLADEGAEVRAFCAELVERSELVEDQRILWPARERADAWKKRTEALKASFLDDLRVLLTHEQEARWPILERELRRLKRVPAGRLPGEAVDLIRVLGDTPGASETTPALAEVLERYSGDLDRAIVARDRFIEENSESFSALIEEDPQAALRLFERSRRVRSAIRDVNDRYARLIAAELPPAAGDDFRRRVFAAGYPSLDAPSRGERYIRAAAELAALRSEQADAVARVLSAYDTARRQLLDRTAKAVWEHETGRLPPSLAEALDSNAAGSQRGFAAFGLGADHPLTALRIERFELDRATRAKIDAILTPEQRRSLPDSAVGAVVFTERGVWGL